jgi:two-component system chemotaxis response regulator CheY
MSALEKTFLIIDRAPENRVLIRDFLRSLGYSNLHEASRVSEALDILNLNEIHCIISEWETPQASGYSLLKLIRSQEKYAKLVFVLMSETESFEKSKLIQAASLKVDGYLLKPFSAETLDKLLKERFAT